MALLEGEENKGIAVSLEVFSDDLLEIFHLKQTVCGNSEWKWAGSRFTSENDEASLIYFVSAMCDYIQMKDSGPLFIAGVTF